MASLTHELTSEYFKEYTLELKDADRIRITHNGHLITFIAVVENVIEGIETERMKIYDNLQKES